MTQAKTEPDQVNPEPTNIEPNRSEHGVFGYTGAAVGGFGEDYTHQVAHGEEPQAASDLPPQESDATLRQALQKALAAAHVDAADLRVEVDSGRVTLFGTVPRASDISDLESRARAVPGAVSVTSRLSAPSEGRAS